MHGAGFVLWMSLSGMPPDASLEIALPGDYARLSLGQLLDSVFPEDEDGRLAMEEMLDVVENPDLPDIYDCFLPVFDHYRSGLCLLKLTGGVGRPVRLSDIASDLLQPVPAASTKFPGEKPASFGLELTVEPEYRPLDYAVSQGYAGSEDELLAWLQSCTLLYFLDKHEYRLPPLTEMSESSPLQPIAKAFLTANSLPLAVKPDSPRLPGRAVGSSARCYRRPDPALTGSTFSRTFSGRRMPSPPSLTPAAAMTCGCRYLSLRDSTRCGRCSCCGSTTAHSMNSPQPGRN